MIKKLLNKKVESFNGEGFTLIEITITIVILGILSAISIVTVNEQIRHSHVATLKSDVRSNIPHVMNMDGKITTPEMFAEKARSTDVNVVSLAIDGSDEAGGEQIACVWGTRVFSDNDVVSYYWSSETGKLQDGTCLGVYPSAVIISTSDPEAEPGTPDEHEHEDETSQPPVEDTSNPSDNSGGGGVGGEIIVNPPANDDSSTPPTNGTGAGNGQADNTLRVVICHAQGKGKQSRWVSISPNNNGTLNGHIPNHGSDIVPPIENILPNGYNWTPKNIEIWNNECKKP